LLEHCIWIWFVLEIRPIKMLLNETCSKASTSKSLCNAFHTQNAFKPGSASS
jgi:hypothetical protein